MLITYHNQDLAYYLNEILEMVKGHYEEISLFSKLGYEFNPDVDAYVAFSKSGQIKLYTAKFEDMLLGYVIYMIYPHPHCKGVNSAMMDMIYIDPKYRKLGVGKDLIKYAETHLKSIGINFVISAMTVDYDFTPLMNSLDYKPMDKLFYKEI